jgi:TrmH family RNA methyltransferase
MLVKSQIKYIQSLGQKKQRDETGLFIAEGPKLVTEMLREIPQRVKQVYALQEWINANRKKSSNPTTEWIEITATELERISQLATPNQVLAVLEQMEETVIQPQKNEWVLTLDTIQDPGNLGTIIRIADWFAVKHIVCSPDTADLYNPKVVQSTMGSIVRVSIVYTDLPAWLAKQQENRIYAAVLEGQDITTMKKTGGGILVIGNESKGISSEVLELVNVKVTIPQKGKAESLNAAVATGILLSHMIS